MASSPNPQRRLQVSASQPVSATSTADSSPVDATARIPYSSLGNTSALLGASRPGAESPSHDTNVLRPFSKRAREIQASEGVSGPFWGPPASSGSTPLREVIPESHSQDGFSDFVSSSDDAIPGRRPRAGTMPSRFSPSAPPGFSAGAKPSRPTPSTSPFKATSLIANEPSALLSRLRAGSLPQAESGFVTPQWDGSRLRSSTLSNSQTSLRQPSVSKDLLNDADVKTLDYLGLAEAPRQVSGSFGLLPELAALRNVNRIRSYSVNAQEQYQDENTKSGIITPMDAALAQTRAQIHHHNLAVQAFASQASANRPRAQTAGVLDSPLHTTPASLRYIPPPTRPRQLSKAVPLDWSEDLESRPDLLQASLTPMPARAPPEDLDLEKATRALWLGNVPSSTTTASLDAIFGSHGKIESSRVLVHKNCGFVNFERVESAASAKAALNGKEILPGAGPIRVGYAKVPAPSPVLAGEKLHFAEPERIGTYMTGELDERVLPATSLVNAKAEILDIAFSFDKEDKTAIVESACEFTAFVDDIQPVPEASQHRSFDAPRLRDIRKQIDHDLLSIEEIEAISDEMLPEICELASDYLGNTVVQKLFEFCSEAARQRMLDRLAPMLAQIGVHKNGTWAAQKIIEVTRTPSQMAMIVDHVRPYTVALFLDQYGNYMLQGILRFGSPYNNFIFETMLSRTWDIGQGRFGARAMRACLESPAATRIQHCIAAAAIVWHGAPLSANANGMLLLTWLLDTCTLPRRRHALALRLQPHLSFLSVHRTANMTLLKILNQQSEPDARDLIVNSLFFGEDDRALQQTLEDANFGANFVFRALMAPSSDEERRRQMVQKVRDVLLRLQVMPNPNNKRLLDEVGLTTRTPAFHPYAGYSNGGYETYPLGRGADMCYPGFPRPMQLPVRPFVPQNNYGPGYVNYGPPYAQYGQP